MLHDGCVNVGHDDSTGCCHGNTTVNGWCLEDHLRVDKLNCTSNIAQEMQWDRWTDKQTKTDVNEHKRECELIAAKTKTSEEQQKGREVTERTTSQSHVDTTKLVNITIAGWFTSC